MKEKLIDPEKLRARNAILKSPIGKVLVNFAMKLTGANKINRVYDSSKAYEGVAFCNHLLKDIGINIVVENKDVIKQFEGKAFVTVSNHAYGHIDGIAAIDVIASERPDYKMMVNFILGLIDTMSMHFIVVNPYSTDKISKVSNLEGIKQCLDHLKNGHPLGFFPAGAVSKTKVRGGKLTIEDREWQDSVTKIIKKSKVPVIPMYFSGENSWFFKFLDLVSWKLRSLRLGHEVYNKRGKTIHVRLGDPIMPEEMAKIEDIKELGDYLKAKTYALAKPSDQ